MSRGGWEVILRIFGPDPTTLRFFFSVGEITATALFLILAERVGFSLNP
jgi:hypothetical protein